MTVPCADLLLSGSQQLSPGGRCGNLGAMSFSSSETQGRQYVTVSELNALLNSVLEESIPSVAFRGEISQFTVPASGHLYFTVKDEESQVQAAMWRSYVQGLSFRPATGLEVLCVGRPNVFRKNGRLQMLVQRMVPAGEGALQRRFLELKAKLEAQGFFAAERKRPLPGFPRAIGVVSSGTGAVIHDIMVKVRARMPNLRVYLEDVRVQGEGAAKEIAAAIDRLSASGKVDVIIVARGGGSLEDLWAFNEEPVVHAVFRARVPVVSGVGHEVDVTLCDLAADLRAPTPTAAAEIVVPDRTQLLNRIDELEQRLMRFERWLAPLGQQVDELAASLQRAMRSMFRQRMLELRTAELQLRSLQPRQRLARAHDQLQHAATALQQTLEERLLAARERVEQTGARLLRAYPAERVQRNQARVAELAFRLARAQHEALRARAASVAQLEGRLEALSPRAVLSRGYALVQSGDRLVTSTRQLVVGQEVQVQLADGEMISEVRALSPSSTTSRTVPNGGTWSRKGGDDAEEG